jgi:lipopolysaccharide export system permease protein
MILGRTILGRYVFRQSAGAVVLILTSLTGMVWIAVALRQIELLTSQGQGAITFLKMTTLALPTLIAFIAPIALLIACLHTLSRLNGDSELIVMTAGGAPTWRLLSPLLLLAVIVSLTVVAINHVIAPWSQRTIRDYALQIRTDLISQVIQPGRFTTPEPNLTFHIQGRARDGELQGLLMHDARDDKQVTSYLAERGYIVKQDKTAYLLMQNGHILRRNAVNGPVDIIVFERYAVDIARFEQKAEGALSFRPRERYTSELLNPAPADLALQAADGRYRAELHDRLANPLYPIAFMLIALAFAGQAVTTRQNRSQGVIFGFAIAVGCRVAGIGVTNSTAVKPSMVIWQYAVPLIAIVIAAIAIQLNMTPRPAPRAVRVARLKLQLAIARAKSVFERKPKNPTTAHLARRREQQGAS